MTDDRGLVWIVDDVALDAHVVRRALEPQFRTRIFEQGTTLLEALSAEPSPDAIVLDWYMPDVSGLEVCKFVRASERIAQLPIVIVTGAKEDVVEGLDAGANDFVAKPFDARELSARVASLVRTKRLHEKLLFAQRELERDIEFRERFTGVLGHDLRQPLNTFLLGLRSLSVRDLSERDAATVRRLTKASQRMNRMISDLLDLTRVRSAGGIPVDVDPMDMRDACTTVVEEMQLAYPDRKIELVATDDTHGVWDRDRIIQICTNLVANAIEHGSHEVPVTVALRGGEREVTLEVHNGGQPIDKDLLPVLFDPFRRGRASGSRGLGLGLFIVHELARAHQGTVDVKSDASGTRFRIVLPKDASAEG